MSRAKVLGTALVLVGAIATATPAAAQVTVGTDVALFSDYVWRGIQYTNKFVIEPDAYLIFPVGPAAITIGGWANIEPGKYDGATDISEGAGAASFDLTEFDWWGEVNYTVATATLTGGVTGYIFPNDAGFTKLNNTVEIYGKVTLANILNPKLAVWYDVDKIKGAYFEGSVSHSFPVSPKVSVTLGALAGLNAGQDCEDPGDALLFTCTNGYNFQDNGFTHLDLSASVPLAAGPLSITPVVHFIVGGDDLTKYTALDPSNGVTSFFNKKDAKVWFGATISWSKAFGGAEEAAAEAE